MNEKKVHASSTATPILVLGATGKTGRRVAARLEAMELPIRRGSRSATPAFDWNQRSSWDACLDGMASVYINYPSDLPIPGSSDTIAAFVNKAKAHGVRHLVLLSGRGEPEARVWEDIVKESGVDWTIVRSSWFQQNFSEGGFAEMVAAGEIVLPAGAIPEPFVNLDDIADIVVAALTRPGHTGELYEATGPRLLTFADVAEELSNATGRTIAYQQIPLQEFLAAVTASGAPEEAVWLMDYLFGRILDGRNAYVTDGVQKVLGRAPKDISAFAREVALTQTWRQAA